MIITRAPLRITLGGGGTDLPSYNEQFGGVVLSAAISKYIFIAVNRTFTPDYFLKYSALERVEHPRDIEHPIVREVLEAHDIGPSVEIVSMADIPAGTGLGSSGAFTVGLLHAVYAFRRDHVTPGGLADEACTIEIERLRRPVGKQDQYVAAFGGINAYEFRPDDSVVVTPLSLSDDTLREFEVRVLLFSTGIIRQAPEILKDQDDRTKQGSAEMIRNLHHVKEIGYESKAVLEAGRLDAYGALLHEHWEHKRRRSKSISNPRIDHWYGVARASGAAGGKLIGAGGGGFLMFLADDPTRLRKAMEAEGLAELRFNFDYEGTRILS